MYEHTKNEMWRKKNHGKFRLLCAYSVEHQINILPQSGSFSLKVFFIPRRKNSSKAKKRNNKAVEHWGLCILHWENLWFILHAFFRHNRVLKSAGSISIHIAMCCCSHLLVTGNKVKYTKVLKSARERKRNERNCWKKISIKIDRKI